MQAHVSTTVGGILRALFEVLLKRRVYGAGGGVVKFEQRLGQGAIVHPFFLEQGLEHVGIAVVGNELADVLLIQIHARLVQLGIEGELRDSLKELALKVGIGLCFALVDESEQVLEHAACCTRGGLEFLDVGSLSLVFLPEFDAL